MNETIFINKSGSRRAVLGYDRKIIFVLEAGEERKLPSGTKIDNPFERFSEITYGSNGVTSAVENRSWKRPEGNWITEFINTGPNETEVLEIDGTYLYFFRQIPRSLSLPLNDPNVFFSEVRWVPETNILNHWSGEPGKTFEIVVSGIKRTLRPKRDLEKIKAELEEAAARPAKSAAEKRLGLAEGTITIKDLSGIGIDKKT